MIHPRPTYPVAVERDEDELFEQHRDAGRGDGFLQLGRDKSTRPPSERRSPDRAAGHSPPAVRSALGSGLGGGEKAAVQPGAEIVLNRRQVDAMLRSAADTNRALAKIGAELGVSMTEAVAGFKRFAQALPQPRRSIVVTMQDGVTRRVFR